MNAVVTTLRDAQPVIDSFIQYHLHIGFDKIYLFFDDKDDPSVSIAEKYPQVETIVNDAILQNRWKNALTYPFYKNYLNSEVMARQVLNVEIAMGLCLEDGINWLLHLDIDELFLTYFQTVKDHFDDLDKQNCESVSYLNYESIPQSIHINDYFQEVKYFKKNPKVLSQKQWSYIQKLSIFNNGDDYFWFYKNGKSAVKINSPKLPDGVHAFKPEDNHFACYDAVILHFPICGFQHFWNKYTHLGNFENKWFGRHEINFRMHLKARDITRNNDQSLAKEFYRTEIQNLNALKNDLMEQGILEQIIFPSQLLRSIR